MPTYDTGPTYLTGDMWADGVGSHYLVTTNNVLKNDGALVMGAGAALQARILHPGIDKAFGAAIAFTPTMNYGCLVDVFEDVGLFQTKMHWSHPSRTGLIENSVAMLKDVKETINLNFPGVGYGQLRKDQVRPLLAPLPANIIIWSYK